MKNFKNLTNLKNSKILKRGPQHFCIVLYLLKITFVLKNFNYFFHRFSIKAGSEIFAHYGYKKAPFPIDFPWYFEELERIEEEEKKRDKLRKKQKKTN